MRGTCRAPRGRKRRRRESGAAAVEFALVSTVLITLVFGIIDFGYMINRDTLLNNASFEGAREGALNPVKSAIIGVVDRTADTLTTATAVESAAEPTKAKPLAVQVTCRKALGGTCTVMATPLPDGATVPTNAPASGDTIVVTVKYHYSWITPVGSSFARDGTVLTKTAEMRVE